MDFYEVHTIIFDYILDYDESTKPGYVRIRLRIPGIEPRAGGQLSKILSKDPKAKNVKFIGPVCDIRWDKIYMCLQDWVYGMGLKIILLPKALPNPWDWLNEPLGSIKPRLYITWTP